jgi:hypothetical protein
MWEQLNQILRQAADRIVENVVSFLPGVLASVVLLICAVIVAVIVRLLVLRTLRGLQFDRRVDHLGLSILADWSASKRPSLLVARLAYWAVLLIGLLMGLTALDATLPSEFAVSVFRYLPHLLAALLILIVGGLLARFLARSVLIGAVNLQIQSARLLSLAVKWLVLIIAAAMALEHIGIGRQILLLSFGIVFAGIVLALALAVGLGARDVVARSLEQWLRRPGEDRDRIDHV